MTPFSIVHDVQMAAIDNMRFFANEVMGFVRSNDHARLENVHKLSWREHVRPSTLNYSAGGNGYGR